MGSDDLNFSSGVMRLGSSAGGDPFTPLRLTLRSPSSDVGSGGGGGVASETDESNVIIDHRGARFIKSNKIIGRGTFGEVCVGMREDGALCAIKTMQLPTAAFASFGAENAGGSSGAMLSREVEALLSEVGTLSTLRHENIVRYYSSAVVRGEEIAIMMEYVSGGSLARLLGYFGRVPSSSTRRYAKDILKGLAYLHGKGIIHRDVGPNNTLLTVDGACKLSDFGCSTTLERLNGVVAGTPWYMSPESARGCVTTASDIWSFGVLIGVLLTGALPYPHDVVEAPVEEFIKRLAATSSDDSGLRPSFAEWPMVPDARDLIEECTRRDPAQRPTAAELLHHPFIVG